MDKALDNIEQILDEHIPDQKDPNYLKLLSAKKDAAVSIINAGLKADENRFRKRANDALAKLFEAVEKEEALLGHTVDHAPQELTSI